MAFYMFITKQDVFDDNFLFRPCFRSGSYCKLIKKNKPLSYTRGRECILEKLRPFTGNLNIGLHSLRSGRATVAGNVVVNDKCRKRHGWWKSDSSKDSYVAVSLSRGLEASKVHLL
jgi:hypothetical protein